VKLRSTEVLRLLAEDGGGSLVDQLGAPHTDIKLRTLTVKRADGRVATILHGDSGAAVLRDFIEAGFVYESVPLDEEFRRVYRLTPDGLRTAPLARNGPTLPS
jgi:hypothetical protein